jgi:hypothetical protein
VDILPIEVMEGILDTEEEEEKGYEVILILIALFAKNLDMNQKIVALDVLDAKFPTIQVEIVGIRRKKMMKE